MSDDDMIRRGDAIAAANDAVLKYLTEDFETPPEAYIRDAVRTLPAVQVGVRPLKWGWSDQVQGWRADCELTRDVFVAYETNAGWVAGSQTTGSTVHASADAAKSALDGYRADRIRSALTAVPSPDVAGMVEAVVSAYRKTRAVQKAWEAKGRGVSVDAPYADMNFSDLSLECGRANSELQEALAALARVKGGAA